MAAPFDDATVSSTKKSNKSSPATPRAPRALPG